MLSKFIFAGSALILVTLNFRIIKRFLDPSVKPRDVRIISNTIMEGNNLYCAFITYQIPNPNPEPNP